MRQKEGGVQQVVSCHGMLWMPVAFDPHLPNSSRFNIDSLMRFFRRRSAVCGSSITNAAATGADRSRAPHCAGAAHCGRTACCLGSVPDGIGVLTSVVHHRTIRLY
ncbi:unnamed protein product [Ostreobium quekettii]|uniref:Uncharacterized protein n=1 Tax=Ostreobium quekettii TaxID=121088 RepID=A0A8S1JEM5_9CHLO|nr:unnamed protein product [Ostreobium quekettii]